MNNFIQECYRSLNIALIGTLILIAMPTVLIKHVNAQEVYAEQVEFSEAELAQLLAPIALYPDSLLTHILIASTYPLEIVQANRWRTENRHLNANQAMRKAEDKNWDPSVIALLAFPNVLEKLSDDLVWTQKLGDAFLQDETKLLSSIQSLRQQADRVDSLSEMENMSVTRVDNQIIIEPVQKEIIYVPYYDSRVVYGHWRWYSYPPVYWHPYPYYVRRPHDLFYWGSGIHITFNYYFSTFNWHKHHIVVVNHHNSHHYRHRVRIITSHGAQRWNHKPYHRHSVAYRSQHVKERYNVRPPRRIGANQVQNKLREQRTEIKKNYSKESNSSKLPVVNKYRTKQDKQPFSNQMHKPQMNEQHKEEKREQRVKSREQRLINKTDQPQTKKQDKAVKREQRVKSRTQQFIHKTDLPQAKKQHKTEKREQRLKSHKEIKPYQPGQAKSFRRPQREVNSQKQREIYLLQQNNHKQRQNKRSNDK